MKGDIYMGYKEFISLKAGDLITPKGKALDRDRVFRFIERRGNDVVCEIIEGVITMPNNFDGINMCESNTVRRYKYHIVQRVV